VRLPDDSYYQTDVLSHTAQGDLYANIPFGHTTVLIDEFAAEGRRPRPTDDGPDDVALVAFHAPAIVCSYTCGFVAQPPGTHGYSHPYRLVAPIVPLRHAIERGLPENQARAIRDNGGVTGMMYLPWPEDDDVDDEWRHQAVALLYRPNLVTQSLLDNRERLGRLSLDALRILEVRLIQVVAPPLYDPADMDPDRSDSWDPPA
jgi:hypothetical protein